jgi:hypothetical protein
MNNQNLLSHLKKLYDIPEVEESNIPTDKQTDIPDTQEPAAVSEVTSKDMPQYYGHYNTEGMTSINPTFGQPQSPSTSRTGSLGSPSSRWKAQITKDTTQGLQNYNNPTKTAEGGIQWADVYRSALDHREANKITGRYGGLEDWQTQYITGSGSSDLSEEAQNTLNNLRAFTRGQIYTGDYSSIPEDQQGIFRPNYIPGVDDGSLPSSIGSPYTRQYYDEEWLWGTPEGAAIEGPVGYAALSPVLSAAARTAKISPYFLAKQFRGLVPTRLAYTPYPRGNFTGFGKDVLTGLKNAPTRGLALSSLGADLLTGFHDNSQAVSMHRELTNEWDKVHQEYVDAGGDPEKFPYPRPNLADIQSQMYTARGDHLADTFEEGGTLKDIWNAAGLVAAPYQVSAMLNAPDAHLQGSLSELGADYAKDPQQLLNQLYSGSAVPEDERYGGMAQLSPDLRDQIAQRLFYQAAIEDTRDPSDNWWDRNIVGLVSRSLLDDPTSKTFNQDMIEALGSQIQQGDITEAQLNTIVDRLGLDLGKPNLPGETFARENPQVNQFLAEQDINRYLPYNTESFFNTMQAVPEDVPLPIHVPYSIEQARRAEEKDQALAEEQAERHKAEERVLQQEQENKEIEELVRDV